MPLFTYDTSVIISREVTKLPGRPGSFLMSAVVLMELTASARDASQRKVYERLFRKYQEDNSLIIPDESDWLLAARVLFLVDSEPKTISQG
jgi:hypothetical protein